MSVPRLLVLMGSGETSPTMVTTHREVLARLGPGPVPAVVLDTPFGFQGNADDLVARAQAYFRESVGQRLDVASFRSASEVGSFEHETMLARLRDARFVFAGPGSPTYALRQWRASLVPQVLHEKLAGGGCVTFASAAALTLGVATVPVYEIYKVGADAVWEPGLDLLGEAGLKAAVIPHYNNAEGGSHDTRFCYLGESRLARMEHELPEDAFVLGVDEHTGLVLDLEAASATVVGMGVVTVRAGGRSHALQPGSVVGIEEIRSLAGDLRGGGPPAAGGVAGPATEDTGVGHLSPLLDDIAAQEAAFRAALDGRDVPAAVRAILHLEGDLHEWSADTLDSDHLDQGRAAIRSMVVRLGEVAVAGARDPRELVGPFVDGLLDLRDRARAQKHYDDADAVRDLLVGLGVVVSDTPAGTGWELLRPVDGTG